MDQAGLCRQVVSACDATFGPSYATQSGTTRRAGSGDCQTILEICLGPSIIPPEQLGPQLRGVPGVFAG